MIIIFGGKKTFSFEINGIFFKRFAQIAIICDALIRNGERKENFAALSVVHA